jgi:hypothetical protein
VTVRSLISLARELKLTLALCAPLARARHCECEGDQHNDNNDGRDHDDQASRHLSSSVGLSSSYPREAALCAPGRVFDPFCERCGGRNRPARG